LAEQELDFEISSAALDTLGEAGFDPVYGARPLKRAIQNLLETPLAEAILDGRYLPHDTVTVDSSEDGIALGVARADAA
jgi:ATP-dependent Clp protease ATP-binding subunit ClpB